MTSMDERDALIADLQQQVADQQRQIAEKDKRIAELTEENHSLASRVEELQQKLGLNSKNSSISPSQDPFRSRKSSSQSLRQSSGRRPGGQAGHPGANINLQHEPDEEVEHFPEKCRKCPLFDKCRQNRKVFKRGECRYELNVVLYVKITRHQVIEVSSCPRDDTKQKQKQKMKGSFPENIRGYIQYGDSFTVLAGLLSTFGAVSVKRIHDLMSSMFGVSISTGTIMSMISKCAKQVGPVLPEIRKLIASSDVAHFDETGTDMNGRNFWVHCSSTGQLTLLTANQKRGKDGMDGNGVLPLYKGTAVHDCWGPYWWFQNVIHAVCLAHILRELNWVIEFIPEHTWAAAFRDLLLKMKKAREDAIERGEKELSSELLSEFDKEYDRILRIADKECPDPPDPPDRKRGRKKKGKERALIERLRKLKDSVCLFVHDFAVPFTNNQAERDVRNVKTKNKIAGSFRTEDGLQDYLDIMSYLGTAKKHGVSVFEALTAAFNGNLEIIIS